MSESLPSTSGQTSAAGRLWQLALRFPGWVTFCVALLPRLVFLIELRLNSPTFYNLEGGDSILYDALAQGAAEPFHAYFHSPLYIGFLKAVYSVIGRRLFLVRLLQLTLGALSCVLVVRVTERLFHSRAMALGTGLVAAIVGPVIFYEGMITIDAIMPVLVLATALLCLDVSRGTGSTRWILAGIAVGVTALGRPVVFMWIPLVLFWALRRRDANRERLIHAAAFGLSIIAVIAPVTFHNLRAEGDLVLITSNSGLNLFIGNNDDADGQYVLPHGLAFRKGDPSDDFGGRKVAELAEKRTNMTSAEVSSWWSRQAREFISDNKGKVLVLVIKKLDYLLNTHEITQLQDFYVYREVAPILFVLPTSFILMAPGLAGLVLLFLGRRKRQWLLARRFAWLAILFGAGFLPFFVVGRYRVPLILLLAPFAGFFVSQVAAAPRTLRGLAVPGVLLGLSLLMTLHGIPFPSRAFEYIDFAQAALENGDRAGAVQWCTRSLERDPERVDAASLLARLYREDKKYDLAEKVLVEAEAHDKTDGVVRYEHGRVLLETGRAGAAVDMLQASLDLDPRSVPTWKTLAEALRRVGRTEDAAAAERSAGRLRIMGSESP